MKRRWTKASSFLLGATLLLGACKKDAPAPVSYLPESANLVVGVNTNEIIKKVQWDLISEASLFGDGLSVEGMYGIFEDPQNAGIDLFSEAFLFLEPGEEKKPRVVFVMALKDADKFTSQIVEEYGEVNKDDKGGFKYASGEEELFVWNETVFLTGINCDVTYLSSILAKAGKSEIMQHDKFKSAYKDNSDIFCWLHNFDPRKYSDELNNGMNMDQLYSALGANPETIQQQDVVFKMNFDDGAIKFDQVSTFNADVPEIAHLYRENNDLSDVYKTFNSGKAYIAIGMAVDMGLITKQLGSEQSIADNINQSLSALGTTMEELGEVIEGDIGLVANDVVNAGFVPQPQVSAVMNLKDEKRFLEIVEKMQGVKVKDGFYKLPFQNINIGVNKKMAYVSNSYDQVEAFMDGKGEEMDMQGLAEHAKNPMVVYLNLDDICEQIPWMMFAGPNAEPLKNALVNALDDMYMVSEGFDASSKSQTSKGALVMKDAGENSLVSLIKMFSEIKQITNPSAL